MIGSIAIRRALPADAAVLAELARRTFVDTFAATNDPGDMALHVARTYGVAQQSAELTDPASVTFFAECDGRVAGYTQLRRGVPPACVTGPEPLEVQRFYVGQPWHGRGVAQALMAAVLEEAISQGARTLWLGVWEHNERAKAFYRKCGFSDVGSHPFVLGNDPQVDRIMTRPVSVAS